MYVFSAGNFYVINKLCVKQLLVVLYVGILGSKFMSQAWVVAWLNF